MRLLFIIDGLGDTARPSPLKQAEFDQFLDSDLYSKVLYSYQSFHDSRAPPSDQCLQQILKQHIQTSSRGLFEALGLGLSVEENGTAFKCVFAYINTDTNIVITRHPVISDGVGRQLVQRLQEFIDSLPKIKAVLKHQEEHRFALAVNVLTEFQNDPEYDGHPLTSVTDDLFAREFARDVQQFVLQDALFKQSGVNCVLFRNPSHPISVRSKNISIVPNKLSLDQVSIVSDAPVICGVGRAYGIKSVYRPDHYNSEGETYDMNKLLIFHFERTDYWSHHKNMARKVEEIQKAGRILQHLIGTRKFQSIIVTGDHRTPVCSGMHEGGTVPLLLLRKRETAARTRDVTFSDESCQNLPTVYGDQLLELLFE